MSDLLVLTEPRLEDRGDLTQPCGDGRGLVVSHVPEHLGEIATQQRQRFWHVLDGERRAELGGLLRHGA